MYEHEVMLSWHICAYPVHARLHCSCIFDMTQGFADLSVQETSPSRVVFLHERVNGLILLDLLPEPAALQQRTLPLRTMLLALLWVCLE